MTYTQKNKYDRVNNLTNHLPQYVFVGCHASRSIAFILALATVTDDRLRDQGHRYSWPFGPSGTARPRPDSARHDWPDYLFMLCRSGPHAEASAQARHECLLSVSGQPDITYGLSVPCRPLPRHPIHHFIFTEFYHLF
jgi:hypothetical protein